MADQINTDPAYHYDMITDAWRYIFGDNFHFGYFVNTGMTLDQATDALIETLSNLGEINSSSRILDIGCGIGNPAFHLHNKYGCSITGISTSQRGIELARQSSEAKGLTAKVQFQIADGTNSGFPNGSFDFAWVLESSHLMNKSNLFSECYRVLRSGGTLLLCDIMLRKQPSIIDHLKYLASLRFNYLLGYLSMKKAFGRGKTKTFAFYQRELGKAGFQGVELTDISDQVVPTIDEWRRNITNHQDRILNKLSQERMNDFLSACDLLEKLFRDGIHGYGLIKAKKP